MVLFLHLCSTLSDFFLVLSCSLAINPALACTHSFLCPPAFSWVFSFMWAFPLMWACSVLQSYLLSYFISCTLPLSHLTLACRDTFSCPLLFSHLDFPHIPFLVPSHSFLTTLCLILFTSWCLLSHSVFLPLSLCFVPLYVLCIPSPDCSPFLVASLLMCLPSFQHPPCTCWQFLLQPFSHTPWALSHPFTFLSCGHPFPCFRFLACFLVHVLALSHPCSFPCTWSFWCPPSLMCSLFAIPWLFSYTCYFPCAYSTDTPVLPPALTAFPFPYVHSSSGKLYFSSHISVSCSLSCPLPLSFIAPLAFTHSVSLPCYLISLSPPATPCFACWLFLVHSLFLVFFLTAVMPSHVLHLHASSSSRPHNSSCTSYSLCPHSFTWTCFFLHTCFFLCAPPFSHPWAPSFSHKISLFLAWALSHIFPLSCTNSHMLSLMLFLPFSLFHLFSFPLSSLSYPCSFPLFFPSLFLCSFGVSFSSPHHSLLSLFLVLSCLSFFSSLILSLSHEFSFMLPSLHKYSLHQSCVLFPIEGEVNGCISHFRILEVCNKFLNSSFLSRSAQSTTSDGEAERSLLYGKILTVIKNKCCNKKNAVAVKTQAQLDVQCFHVFHKLGTNFPGSINSLVPRIGSSM